MAKKSTAVLAFLLMLAMVLGAFTLGAYRSFSEKRSGVMGQEGTISEKLKLRCGVGANMLVVAKRHLMQDAPEVAALQKSMADMRTAVGLSRMDEANRAFDRAADALLRVLNASESVAKDERDLAYVTSLFPQKLELTARNAEQTRYNAAAEDYNRLLKTSFSGFFARLIGFRPIPLFETEAQP